MPARSALRVIQRHNNNEDNTTSGFVSDEDAVLGAYQVLADTMGASLEVTLDGQVVLYTGYFKPSAQKVEYIEARDPTPEDLTSEDYSAEQQLRWKKDAELSY
jgi:hypothetical protein